MVNLVWLLLLLAGIFTAALSGKIDQVTASALEAAELGIAVAIQLMGVMSLWMGIMHIAEKAGLVQALAKISSPLIRRLFPSLKENSPAFGPIVMNLCANILGLGNAATPFGLKAMQELQKENPVKDTASSAMITFLALNTSCITIVPASIIAVRMKAGSISPTEIIGTTIFATTCAMNAAIIVDYLFRKRHGL
ncbi:MAG: spore maturation protein [Peptococcaceae bacterium]|nr:spore maturation protein [Peptococcaceae bacterium]